MTNREEIQRRRTFAIISHPDAGKTTLTEKLLLYGGAINQAGSVKGKQSAKHAVSDWMDIEKQRGISVTSSVLQFNFAGKCVNILDTPGHQDFSEDTYRTLMAADSAVMVIDAAKGVEAQTIKLFKVCTLRHIPIFTFINKMDREAQDPFELMENIEEILGIKTYPMNWPIGCGKEFKGVFDRNERKVLAFSSDGRANGVKKVKEVQAELGDAALDELLTPYLHQQLVDEIELLDGAAEEFDLEKVRCGELSRLPAGRTGPGVLRLGTDQLWCRAVPGELPAADLLAPGPGGQPDRGAGGPLPGGVLRLHLQDPGQHEQGPPGPHRLYAHLLGQIRAGHGGIPRPAGQEHQAGHLCLPLHRKRNSDVFTKIIATEKRGID